MSGEAGYVVPVVTLGAVGVAIVAVLVMAGAYVAWTVAVDDFVPWLRREARAWRDRRSLAARGRAQVAAWRDVERAADEAGRGGR